MPVTGVSSIERAADGGGGKPAAFIAARGKQSVTEGIKHEARASIWKIPAGRRHLEPAPAINACAYGRGNRGE